MYIAIDLETTGFDPALNEIIEIAAVRFDPFGSDIGETFDTLVKPKNQVPLEVKRLTGLRDGDFENAPAITETIGQLKKFMEGFALVGHNVPFDIAFLKPVFPEIVYFEMFDSLTFARTLSLRETSYALDQLCKKLKIPHEETHRALSDAKATALLFQRLVQQAQEISTKTYEKLECIFQKTNWPYKKYFGPSRKAASKKNEFPKEVEKEGAKRMVFPPSDQRFLELNKNHDRVLYETPGFPPLETFAKTQRILFSYGRFHDWLNVFPVIHDESHYLSPEKLEKLISSATSLDDDITAFLVKMILFESQTKVGLRHEISLHGKEWVLWELVRGDGRFFRKALREAEKSSVICVPHESLPSLSLRHKVTDDRTLIVGDALLLEENLTFSFEKRFSLERLEIQFPHLSSKLQILFGLLGMYYQTHGDIDQQTDLLIPTNFHETFEGRKIIECALGLKQEDSSELNDLLTALRNVPSARIRWLSYHRDNIVIHDAPLRVHEKFHEILGHAKKVVIFDHALSLDDDFSFFQSVFELRNWATEVAPHEEFKKIEWNIPERLPEPNTEGYFQTCASIIEETIEAERGGVLVIFHTRKALEAHFEAFIEKPIASKIHLFAQRKTGGLGKNIDKFLERPKESILFATTEIFPHMEKLASVLRALVFQKIPFEFSFHPLTKKRQEMRKDGFHSYTIPKALLRLKRFLSIWASLPGEKKLIFLDPRLLRKEFGALLRGLNQE